MSPLKRPGVRQRPETIIALVDVVFFLLVFALLIGRMDATAPFQVAPPIAKNGVDLPAGGVTVTLGDGKMALDGVAMSPPDLRQQLAQRIADDPAMRIRLQADRRLQLRDALPLMGALERFGATDVVLVVTPGG